MIWRAKGVLSGLLLGMLAALPAGCSDDKEAPQEVVAPATEKTPYPEDPDLALGDKKEAASPAAPENPTPNESAAVGELTTDQAPPPPPTPPQDNTAANSGGGPAAPADDGNAVGGAFAQNTPSYEPAPGSLPPEEATQGTTKHAGPGHKHHGKHAKHGKATAASGQGVRYVNANLLNVRSSPNRTAKRVRQLTKGSQITVELHGKWAKIKTGEWIRTKYLSEAPVQ